MADVNEIVVKNFNDNVEYLQKNHSELFKKIGALENAIANNLYQERYELVYENGYFDVVEKSSKNYLYAQDSTKYASLVAKSIDMTTQENCFSGFYNQEIDDEMLQNYLNEDDFEHQMSGFAPIINFIQKHLPHEKELKELHKFIFFGVGLGLHIQEVAKKIQSKLYFIVEDDLELFRLSLFTCNYKTIAQTSELIFSVFETQGEFLESSKRFLEHKYYYNHYIKYFHTLNHDDAKIAQFHRELGSQSHLLFFYHSLLTQYLQPLEYLFDGYYFLEKGLHFNDARLRNKPFLLVAAGPSLERNLPWLRKNHTKFIVVALSATLSILEKEGITPDIVTHLDAFKNAEVHFEKLESLEFIKDCVLIFSSRVPTHVIKMFDKEHLFLLENSTQYKKNSLKPSAPCIGSLTYQLLLRLSVQEIYLLGLDLAIDAKTGRTHSGEHSYNQSLDVEEKLAENSVVTFKESLFEYTGNLQPKVLTTPNFHISIEAVNMATKVLKTKEQRVYNLNDGAAFIDVTPQKVDDVPLYKNEEDMKNVLLELCKMHSSNVLSSDEIAQIRLKRDDAKEIQEYFENLLRREFGSFEEFLAALEAMVEDVSSLERIKHYEISRVLDTYFKYILGYIFDFYNTKNLQTGQKEIKELQKLLCEHSIKILGYYKETISSKLG